MKYALDLTRYAWRQQHGDITAYGTWWLGDDSGPRPCLVLIPTYRQNWQRSTPCVVLMEDAWRWSEEIGDPVHAVHTAIEFAAALGLDASGPTQPIRVRSIIADHLGDLLAIPPMPADMRVSTVLGEAKVTAREEGRVIRHHEVIERV